MSDHKNEKIRFKFKIKNKFKDALTRQADESVRINMREKSELLNSKNEFNHPPIARIIVEKRKYNAGTQSACSRNETKQ